MLLRRCVQISAGIHIVVLISGIIISRWGSVIQVSVNTNRVIVGSYVVDPLRKRGVIYGKQTVKAQAVRGEQKRKIQVKKNKITQKGLKKSTKIPAKKIIKKTTTQKITEKITEKILAEAPVIPVNNNAVTSIGREDIILVQQQEYIRERMRELWSAPVGIIPKQTCKVLVHIDSSGAARDVRVTQSSGVRLFDMHVAAAAKKLILDTRYGSITIELECGGEGLCGE